MMVPDTWDDVKRRKNDFVSKTIFFLFFTLQIAPLKPLDMALESILTGVIDVEI